MNYQTYSRRRAALVSLAILLLLLGGGSFAYLAARAAMPEAVRISLGVEDQNAAPKSTSALDYRVRRAVEPARTELLDAAGKVIATMTDGSRTVHLNGPARTFTEARFTQAKLTTEYWVRLAPQEWSKGAENAKWFAGWFAKARSDRSPDVLAIAFQYTYTASPKKDKNGRQYAGDAAFGPLSDIDPDGRAENSDFYDYLGISWEFSDKKEKPSASHIRSLDCSGFLRMVYGYRLGYPLRGTNNPGPGLPRRALGIAAVGPGTLLMPNTGKRATALDRLLPGDMVFFHGGPVVPGTHIEHTGMYLGVDDRGHHRFMSSRTGANGPTMGDTGGESILDGTGHYAQEWRTARRI